MSAVRPASHRCEQVALRLHWAARLLASEDGESRPRIDGYGWEEVAHAIGRSTKPRAIQGRGRWCLFGAYGASGLNVEFDLAVDDGGAGGLIVLVEAKAHADLSLSRDHALVFSCKVRDHMSSPAWGWRGAHMLVASAGRIKPSFSHWCFYEGIDVTDPDRFPLCVLARLPALFPDVAAVVCDSPYYDRLLEVVCDEEDDVEVGPILLQRGKARKRIWGKPLLHELNEIQAQLSEELFMALQAKYAGDAESPESALLGRVKRELERCGVRNLGQG